LVPPVAAIAVVGIASARAASSIRMPEV
jgi:hypothetical protein